ncbi:hypothetical protein FACS1894217_11240 [Clostridia bacterium]|nr:hypothetical protein FACS1894217_11240 [Clostridia bacterium]
MTDLSYSLDLLHAQFGTTITAYNPTADRYVPCDTPFSLPNFSYILSKTPPSMSEDDFKKSIIEQAQKDFANGYRRVQSDESAALLKSFMQSASPDRKAIYDKSMERTGGKMNITFSFFQGNSPVLRYNYKSDLWIPIGTPAEGERQQDFYVIYNEAYREAVNDARISDTKGRLGFDKKG